MDDKIIERGMTYILGNLLRSHPNSVSFLLLCQANLMYYIDFFKVVIDKNPGDINQDYKLIETLEDFISRRQSAQMKSEYSES